MAYQVLARKWRPQDFDSVVGQEPIVTALRNAIVDGRVAQAYLFSGIRGVGKTSVARVFAKALNCETDPPGDPCNECASCSQIASGSDLDTLEIDAATYSKVEQVRELTDSLQYGPARDRYKVVIIDEIHRLSRQAFDALLKIVEEPPAHLVFIFATTEIEAVPATILSRCQSFQFRRVPLAEMVEHLQRISDAEELGPSDHALRLIARAGEGSVRDAVALLDQIATFGGGTVRDEEVSRILGGVDFALFQELLGAIVAGRRGTVSEAVRRVEAEGWDPRHVYGEFLTYCRDALHLALDPANARVELPAEEAAALAREAEAAGYENLLRLLNLLLESEMSVRRSESASLALEITLLRAAEMPKLIAIEKLLSGDEGDSGTPDSGVEGGDPEAEPLRDDAVGSQAGEPGREGVGAAATTEARAQPMEEAVESRRPGEPIEEPVELAVEPQATAGVPPSEPEADEAPAAAGQTGRGGRSEIGGTETAGPIAESLPVDEAATGEVSTGEPATEHSTAAGEGDETDDSALPEAPPGTPEVVHRLLERIRYVKQPLAAHLSGAESLSLKQGVLTIATVPGDSVLERTLMRSSNRKLLDSTVAELLGSAASWRLTQGTGKLAAKPIEAAEDVNEPDVAQDPTVQKVLDLFGGQIESIDRRANPPE